MATSFGMKINDSAGNVAYDSSSHGGVFVEFAILPAMTSKTITSISYPQLPGRNLYVMPLVVGAHSFKIYGPTDTVPGNVSPLGYPVIQYVKSDIASVVNRVLAFYDGTFYNQTILMVFAV